jgi:hypothetical protein
MKRAQGLSLLAVAAVAAIVIYLAARNRQAPFLPADSEHAAFVGAEPCMTCHGPDGGSPQSKNHPLGNDCTRCHGRRD